MVLASTSRSLEQVCIDFLTKTPDTKLRQLVQILHTGDGSTIIQNSVMQAWTNCSFVELSKDDHREVESRIPSIGLIPTLVSLIENSQTASIVASAANTIANLVCDFTCVGRLLLDCNGVKSIIQALSPRPPVYVRGGETSVPDAAASALVNITDGASLDVINAVRSNNGCRMLLVQLRTRGVAARENSLSIMSNCCQVDRKFVLEMIEQRGTDTVVGLLRATTRDGRVRSDIPILCLQILSDTLKV